MTREVRPCEHGVTGPCKRCALEANIAHAQRSTMVRPVSVGRRVKRAAFLDEIDGDFS